MEADTGKSPTRTQPPHKHSHPQAQPRGRRMGRGQATCGVGGKARGSGGSDRPVLPTLLPGFREDSVVLAEVQALTHSDNGPSMSRRKPRCPLASPSPSVPEKAYCLHGPWLTRSEGPGACTQSPCSSLLRADYLSVLSLSFPTCSYTIPADLRHDQQTYFLPSTALRPQGLCARCAVGFVFVPVCVSLSPCPSGRPCQLPR